MNMTHTKDHRFEVELVVENFSIRRHVLMGGFTKNLSGHGADRLLVLITTTSTYFVEFLWRPSSGRRNRWLRDRTVTK